MIEKIAIAKIYPIIVNYDINFLIKNAVSNSGLDLDNLSRDLDVVDKRSNNKKMGLIHPNRKIWNRDVLVHIDSLGLYRPCNIYELIAFGVKYPGVQRGIKIVAAGTVWRTRKGGIRIVPFLDNNGSEQILNFNDVSGGPEEDAAWGIHKDWDEDFWFGVIELLDFPVS